MRNLGLDLLRLFAVLLVIGRHLDLALFGSTSPLLKVWQTGGWVGVDIFFVLSGFLVSSLLFKEHQRDGHVKIKRFLIRRGFKIYPAFWVFLAITIPILYAIQKPPQPIHIAGELLFLQNYLGGVWSHTWSLAIEEHFYIGLAILVAVLVAFLPKKTFASIPYLFLLVAIACLILRILTANQLKEFSQQALLFPTHLRIDSLFFGVLLSYWTHYHNLAERMKSIGTTELLLVGSILLSPAFLFPIEDNMWIAVYGVILFYLGGGALMLAAVRLPEPRLPGLDLLGKLGAASYSIYLWHIPYATLGYLAVSSALGINTFALYLANAIVGACLVGWLMSRLIEYPTLAIRNRLFPSAIKPVEVESRPENNDTASDSQAD